MTNRMEQNSAGDQNSEQNSAGDQNSEQNSAVKTKF